MKKIGAFFWIWICSISVLHAESLLLFAASSTINVVKDVVVLYQKEHGVTVRTSFASSGTLARQIEEGAPAHIFLSANVEWMDYLEKKQLLAPSSRFDLFRNRLVLIVPKSQKLTLQMEPQFDLSNAFSGPLAMGNPHSVPAGIYAKEALEYFQWWPALKSRIINAPNVRAALTFVEREEAELGIVYATDALISKRVDVRGLFPEQSHAPIVYPVAGIAENQTPQVQAFLQFLKNPKHHAIFQKHGFLVVSP